MDARFSFGDEVRTIRNIRNDGSYPNIATGDLLIRRGTLGFVEDVGLFLQDQIIYRVRFIDAGKIVGCRETELIAAAAPWVPSIFENRDKVRTRCALAVQGEIRVPQHQQGEVVKVLRDSPDEVMYHVAFGQTILQVPERSLCFADQE